MKQVFRSIRLAVVSVAALIFTSSLAIAAPYDEAIDGDLSGVPATPTEWMLGVGANTLTGRAGLNASTSQYDYDLVAITISEGMHLDSIELTNYQNDDPFGFGFIGIQAGSPWLDSVGWLVSGIHLMGYRHIEPGMEGSDLLGLMQELSSEPTFQGSLGPGTYTLLIQDVELAYDYEMIFNVSVPEPSSAALLGIGILATLRQRRRGR